MLRAPETIVATWMQARHVDAGITEAEVRDALIQLDPLWDELFPVEQARVVQLLVSRVDVGEAGVVVHLRTDGMATLVSDLSMRSEQKRAA